MAYRESTEIGLRPAFGYDLREDFRNGGPDIVWFVMDFKIGFTFVDVVGPGGAGGAAGTSNIYEFQADDEIYDEPNERLVLTGFSKCFNRVVMERN